LEAISAIILLLGFGGYLSHPIVSPAIGGPILVIFFVGVIVFAVVAVIWAKIEWWWQMRDFRRETRQIIEAREREDKALGYHQKPRTTEEVIEREVARSIANRKVKL
jgi:hypothetical protein